MKARGSPRVRVSRTRSPWWVLLLPRLLPSTTPALISGTEAESLVRSATWSDTEPVEPPPSENDLHTFVGVSTDDYRTCSVTLRGSTRIVVPRPPWTHRGIPTHTLPGPRSNLVFSVAGPSGTVDRHPVLPGAHLYRTDRLTRDREPVATRPVGLIAQKN